MESSKKYVAEVVSFNGGGAAQEGVVGDIKKAILEEIVGSRKVPRYVKDIYFFSLFLRLRLKNTPLHPFFNFEVVCKKNADKFVDADIIHFHDCGSILSAKYALNEYIKDKPKVLTIHSPGSATKEALRGAYGKERYWSQGSFRLLYKLEEEAISFADYLIFPSRGVVELFRDDLRSINWKTKVVFVNNTGIPPLQIEDAVERRRKMRKFFGMGENAIVLLTMGRAVEEKGFDILLEAIAESSYLKNNENLYTVIVSKGCTPMKEELMELRKRLGLEERVIFVDYVKEREDAFAMADIFVAPNRRSAFDLTVLEAMSLGIPVITTASGNADAIEGGGGIVVECGDVSDLSAAIEKLVKDPELRISMGQKAKRIFHSRFTPEKFVERMVEIYDKILSDYATKY